MDIVLSIIFIIFMATLVIYDRQHRCKKCKGSLFKNSEDPCECGYSNRLYLPPEKEEFKVTNITHRINNVIHRRRRNE